MNQIDETFDVGERGERKAESVSESRERFDVGEWGVQEEASDGLPKLSSLKSRSSRLLSALETS